MSERASEGASQGGGTESGKDGVLRETEQSRKEGNDKGDAKEEGATTLGLIARERQQEEGSRRKKRLLE